MEDQHVSWTALLTAYARAYHATHDDPKIFDDYLTEDSLATAIAQGVEQFVILGAGMDTFAFRHPEIMGQLHVFEVDHPATQAFKRQRLASLGWELPAHLHFVAVDFSTESIWRADGSQLRSIPTCQPY